MTNSPNSNSNGNSQEPEVKKVYEPLDPGRWTDLDFDTQQRELAHTEEVFRELDIEEDDEESQSN